MILLLPLREGLGMGLYALTHKLTGLVKLRCVRPHPKGRGHLMRQLQHHPQSLAPPLSSLRSSAAFSSARFCCMDRFAMVRAGLGHKVRGFEQAFKSAGVAPPAFEFVPGHLAALDVRIVHIT